MLNDDLDGVVLGFDEPEIVVDPLGNQIGVLGNILIGPREIWNLQDLGGRLG